MPEAVNNECLVKCYECGSVITATWKKGRFKKGWTLPDGGFFNDGSCPQCHKKMKLKGRATVLCAHCGTLVEKTGDNLCLKCGKKLEQIPSIGSVECPECGMTTMIPKSLLDAAGHVSKSITCPACGDHVFQVDEIEKLINKGQVSDGPAQYIKLPDVAFMQEKKMAIWQHPQNEFSYQSRMQVNEGTWGVFLQNGECKNPCGPGDHLLQNTDLSASEKLDAAFHGEDKVFKMDVFCVLKDLPEMKWGCLTNEFWNEERDSRYQATANGTLSLYVSDVKAYIRYLAFRPVEMDELIRFDSNPESDNSGILRKLVLGIIGGAVYSRLNGRKGIYLETVVPDEIRDDVIAELNYRLQEYGLKVKTLWMNALNVKLSETTAAKTDFVDYVQSENQWQVAGVHYTVPNNASMYADVDFDGTFRLRVTDQKTLMGTSEAKKLLDNEQISEFTVKDFYTKKVQTLLRNHLSFEGQMQINQGGIKNILDPNQYVYALRDRIREKIDMELSLEGLSVGYFLMNIPSDIKASDALTKALDQPARRQAIYRGAESVLSLQTEPVRIHVKGDPSINVDLVYTGDCQLRIIDENGFFGMSEIRGFMDSKQPVSDAEVKAYYTDKVSKSFARIIGVTLQGIVDQTNADIREMNRFSGLLQNSVQESMKQLVGKWGLKLDTLGIDMPKRVAESGNFQKMTGKEEFVTGNRLDEEVQRMQNDHVLFVMDEDGRVKMHGSDVHKDVTIHGMKNEAEIKGAEHGLTKEATIQGIKDAAEIDELKDQIQQDKDKRSDDALLEKYKREFRLREEQINQKIREERTLQEARIEKEMSALQADFDKRLAEAENQRALNDIMHKIAESDLTWQQKLDEYDRLRRMTRARDDADVKKLESDTKIQITKNEDEAWYHSGSLKLRLSREQAQLMEELARYDEDRKERIAAANEARTERRAILDFEQRMQDRREQIAQQMDLVSQRYNQELAMRDKEVDLEKTKAQLEIAATQIRSATSLGIAQTEADAAARIEEAKAAVKRAEDQLKREESLEKQAQDFRNQLLEIQKVLEMTRLGIERNRDDKMAEVAIETAKAMAEGGGSRKGYTTPSSDEYDQLDRKMQKVINSVNNLRGKITELRHQIDILSLKVGSAGTGYTPGRGGSTPPTPTGGQPSMIQCPTCKQMVPKGTQVCPHCFNLIIG